MKTERIIWGLIFVFIGGVLLLDNFEVINFHWGVIWRFWPLVLVIIGANLIFSKEDSARTGVIAVIITIAALAFIAYQGSRPENSREVWEYHEDNDEEDVDNHDYSNSVFTEALIGDVKRAELNIKGGATQYTLSDTTSELFSAEVRKKGGNYSLFKTSKDSVEVLNFKMNDKKKNWKMKEIGGNKAVLKLNSKPVWDVNLEVGAGKIDFDLSSFKVQNVHFQGGAASFKVKLGNPQQATTVKADTGVSEIEIEIPESAACKINVESGLSSNDFEGFNKQEDGSYTTSNYTASSKKIIIDLKGGLSKFEVNRY